MAIATHQTVAVERLADEDFFQVPHLRTVSKCAEWIDRQLARPAPAVLRSALVACLEDEAAADLHSCLHAPTCEHLRDRLAARLLRKSCTLRVVQVDDFPDAAEHLSAVAPADHVLSDAALAELLDRVPGGAAFLARVGADALRAWLEANAAGGGFGWDRLAVPDLREFLAAELPPGSLDAANAVCREPGSYVAQFVGPALVEARDEAESFATQRFWTSLEHPATYHGPLWLPKVKTVVRALHGFAERHRRTLTSAAAARLETLLWALEATAHYRQGYRGFPDTLRLRDRVFAVLAEVSGLPHEGLDPRTNLDRLAALCGVEPTTAQLACHPVLRRLCRGAARRPGRRPPAVPAAGGDGPFGTVAKVLAFLRAEAERTGALPSRAQLGVEVCDRIEARMGMAYAELVEALHVEWGLARPARSANEAALDALVEEAFAGEVAEFRAEWSAWRTSPGHYRVDSYLRLAGDPDLFGGAGGGFELFLEADGPGHFTQVHNWDLAKCRRRDRAKAAALAARRDAGHRLCLVAVHHRALTGRLDQRLDAVTLRRVVAAARAGGHWWVFVRPAGVADMRAHPPGRLVRLGGDFGPLEVWALAPAAAAAA